MELTPHLATLQSVGLIYPSELNPDFEFLFRHALLQDTVYESILKTDRRRLHQSVAEALETYFSERRDEMAATLAFHFLRAEKSELACFYFALAGQFALANYANVEAEQHYRVATQLSTSLPERASYLAGLGEALTRQSKFEEAGQVWQEAIQAYHGLHDFENLARMYTQVAKMAGPSFADDSVRALEICQEGLRFMDGQPPSSSFATLLHQAGRAYAFRNLWEEAKRVLRIASVIGRQFSVKVLEQVV